MNATLAELKGACQRRGQHTVLTESEHGDNGLCPICDRADTLIASISSTHRQAANLHPIRQNHFPVAGLSQKEQLALHEFSVRYRAAVAKQHQTPEQSLDMVRDAVREQYQQEQTAKRSPSVEPPSPTKEHKPEQPEPLSLSIIPLESGILPPMKI